MKIAIILPINNAGKWLERSIKSVLAQTYKQWILVAIDDNSKDESPDIIKSLLFDKRIISIKCDFGNPAETRNLGLKFISNLEDIELIAYLDADDFWEENHLELSVNTILYEGCDMTYSDCKFQDENHQPVKTYGVPYYDVFSLENLKKQNFIYISSVVHKKNKLLFDKQFVPMEDYEMWLKIAYNGKLIKHISKKTVTYLCKNKSYYTQNESEEAKKRIHNNHNFNKMKILATISTKGRYFTTLPLVINSIANQKIPPHSLYMFDDNDEKENIFENELYKYLMMQLNIKGIEFRYYNGKLLGQHHNHQWANEIAKEEKFDYIWRLDDDTAPEPNVLEQLLFYMNNSVGAVGGSILTPPISKNPISSSGKINRIRIEPNIQWGIIDSVKSVDHLHCSYLHRIGFDYNLNLSRAAHREETLHTWKIKQSYEVLVVPNCITWHYKNSVGGIRSLNIKEQIESDELIFNSEMQKYGVEMNWKMVVLDNGLGDHWAFKNILPKLKERYNNIIIACCYPDVFFDDELEIITIQKAKDLIGNIDLYNIYKFMAQLQWKDTIISAYEKMYL